MYTKMSERIRQDLDKNGKIRQLQSAVEGGCGVKLSARTPSHDPLGGLDGSVLPWGLILSCLKVLKIEFEPICIPIFKVWESEQYRLAEILITMLIGGMVHDGGCSAKQPGTNPGRPAEYQYTAEKREVFIENNWLARNLEILQEDQKNELEEMVWTLVTFSKTDKDSIERLGTFEAIAEASKQAPKERLAELIKRADKIGSLLDSDRQKMEDEIQKIQKTNRWHETVQKSGTETVTHNRLPARFHANVDTWLSANQTPGADRGGGVEDNLEDEVEWVE
jgi:hypothetical protein